MRKVAAYSMQQRLPSAAEAAARQSEIIVKIESWVSSKGKIGEEPGKLKFHDGRIGQIFGECLASSESRVEMLALEEPIDAGSLRTEIIVSRHEALLQVYAELRVAGLANNVGPISLEIRCPNIVRQIISSYGDWKLGESILVTNPVPFLGEPGGRALTQVLWHQDRNLPVICVSEDEDGPLHENLASRLAADLTGLGIVAVVDASASWAMTKQRGQDWSCFNGAVRLYWPRLTRTSDPFLHPLWTKSALIRQFGNANEASQRLCRQLRRRILGISAFAVNEPDESRELRRRLATEAITSARKKLEESADWQSLAESYSAENDSLKDANQKLDTDNKDLRAQLESLQEVLHWRQSQGIDAPPEELAPPTTVEEAVAQARSRFEQTLYFGEDVDTGVRGISPEAGPPDKILDYLKGLHNLAVALNAGPLGMTVVQWLKERNYETSTESETILNSKREMGKRSWKGPNGPMQFDLHMKPKEGVSPDKCVRIYFAHEPAIQRVVVGWVGRHPG